MYVAGERIDYVKLGGLVGSSRVWKEAEHALFLQVKSMSGLGCVLISISSVKKRPPIFKMPIEHLQTVNPSVSLAND